MIQATIAIDLTTGSALQGAIFVYECPPEWNKKKSISLRSTIWDTAAFDPDKQYL